MLSLLLTVPKLWRTRAILHKKYHVRPVGRAIIHANSFLGRTFDSKLMVGVQKLTVIRVVADYIGCVFGID
jgi:hypothetical protein